jgi:nitrite reductase/ring-hydroxylating ferredoxin subunit
MGRVKAGDASAIPPGSSVKFKHGTETILVANVGGTLCAIQNACPHREGDISLGEIDGDTVTCPKHGARFDLRSGKNVEGAKLLWWRLRVKDARSFPVTVEGEDVVVEVD